jgi:hypothetical protein
MMLKTFVSVLSFLVFFTLSQFVTGANEHPTCELETTCISESWGISDALINADPRPDVVSLTVDQGRIYDRAYRRVMEAAPLYDAPGGNVVAQLDKGFNFVTILGEQDGWAQITSDRWINSAVLSTSVPVSSFSGVLLPEDSLPYPMAWMIVNTFPSDFPGGEPSEDNELILQYTPIYLYSTIEVDGWQWYQVGVDKWVKQTQIAKVLPVERPADVDTERWISIDLFEQVLIAYEGEAPVFATMIASGLSEWQTNEGLFHIYVRFERTVMSGAEGQPDYYYLEEVPWTMYFDKDIAIHGAYWHDSFGYRRSHGCVNASITDAHWLYHWSASEFDFETPGDEGAAVYVYHSDAYR